MRSVLKYFASLFLGSQAFQNESRERCKLHAKKACSSSEVYQFYLKIEK